MTSAVLTQLCAELAADTVNGIFDRVYVLSHYAGNLFGADACHMEIPNTVFKCGKDLADARK